MGIVLFFFAAAGLLAAEPDLSGTWRLNPDKSDFGSAPRPGAVVTRIRQQAGELAAESTVSGRVSQYRWTLDGDGAGPRVVDDGSVQFVGRRAGDDGVSDD
jgi:hypothetical protein